MYNEKRNFKRFTLLIFLLLILINVPFDSAIIQEKAIASNTDPQPVEVLSKLTIDNIQISKPEISRAESSSLPQEQSTVTFLDTPELHTKKIEHTGQERVKPSIITIETGHCAACSPIIVPSGSAHSTTFSFRPYSFSSLLYTPSELRFSFNGTVVERHNWTIDTWYNYTLYYGNQIGSFDFVAEFDYILSVTVEGNIYNTTLGVIKDTEIIVFDSAYFVPDDSDDSEFSSPQLFLLNPVTLNCITDSTEAQNQTFCSRPQAYSDRLNHAQNENRTFTWEFYSNFPYRYTIEFSNRDFGTTTFLEGGALKSNKAFSYTIYSANYSIFDRNPDDSYFYRGHTYGNTYYIYFTAYDLYGNWIRTRQRILIFDFTKPVVSTVSPQYQYLYEYRTPSVSIPVNVYDDNPKVYSLLLLGRSDFILFRKLVTREPWENGVLLLEIPDDLPIGSYILQLNLYGIGEDVRNHSGLYIFVVIEPPVPPVVISHPNSTETYKTHTHGLNLQWNVTDVAPALYNLTINGSFYVINQPWSSGELISFLHTLELPGIYIYNLTVSDIANTTTFHSFKVISLETVAPIISHGSTLAYRVETSGNYLEWVAYDTSLMGTYSFTSDFLTIQGSWNSGEKFKVLLDGLSLGFHRINLTVTDKFGNQAEDIFFILIYTSVEIIQRPTDTSQEYGNIAESLSWISISNYATNYHLFHNDKKIRSNLPWSSGVAIPVSVSNLEPGRHEFRIEFYDSFFNFNFDTVVVTVVDTINPVIVGPTYAVYEIDNTQGKQLNFTINDLSEFIYHVKVNGILFGFGSSSPYSLNVTSLSLGTNIVSVAVFDSSGNQIEHSASIILQDTISPRLLAVNTPSIYELSYSSPPEATWEVYDRSPARYTIMVNSTIVKTGSWNSTNNVISLSSQTSLGIYNVSFTAEDVSGNIVVNSFIAKVQDTIKPQLAEIPENGTVNFYELKQIQWIINDESGAGNYTILKNGIILKTGNWNALTPIETTLYASSYEDVTFSLIVADYAGNTLVSNRTFSVLAQETPKIEPLDDLYLEDLYLDDLNDSIQLVWLPQNFSIAVYTVSVDGYTIIDNQIWFPLSTINVTLVSLLPGTYYYELTFEDFRGNTATDDVFVTIQDKSPPELEFPTLTYEYSNATISVLWMATDLYPGNYTIIDPENNNYSGSWETNKTNSFSLIDKTIGKYNLTFIVRDMSNNIRTEEITVEIVDTNLPVITGIVTQYEYGKEDLVFSILDASHGSYQISDTNGFNTTGNWDANESKIIPIRHLDFGFYTFTFSVLDAGGNSIQKSFSFTIADTIAPLLPNTSEITFNYNSIGEGIVWHPVDFDPSTYTITMNDIVLQEGNWNLQIEFLTQNLPIGKNFLKISVFDGSNNTASIVTIITIIDTVKPKLSAPKQVFVEYGDNSQILSWKIEDSSSWKFAVTGNDFTLVNNTLDNISPQISLTELTLGTYNYRLTVTDASGNSASITTEVIVLDTTTPLIFVEAESFRTVTLDTLHTTVELGWTATDTSPSTFTILLNDSMVLTKNWKTNKVSYHAQVIKPGFYNYTAIFADNSSNIAMHSYFIEALDTQSAQIQQNHEVLTIELGSTDQNIEWQITDHLANEYFIFKTSTKEFSQALTVSELSDSINATIVASGYCSKNCSITYLLPDITTLQNSQYTLLTYDSSQNIAISTTTVNFVDTTAPEFVLLPMENYSISDRANWAVFDYQTVSYNIQIDGIQVASGNYKMGTSNSIDLAGLTVDVQHSFILTTIDASGNAKSFESTFKIHLNPNSVENSVKYLYLEAGNTEQTLSWQRSTMKKDYKFYVNSNLLKIGTFGTESSFNHFLSELAVGEYNFTLTQSAPGVSETSTTLVTVSDTIAPSITVEAFQKETSTMVLAWTAFDRNPDSYTVTLNGIPIEVSTWVSGREQHLILENLNPQSYQIEITVSDKNQNGNNSIIEFTIDNQTPFTISIYNIYVIILLAFISIPVFIGLTRKSKAK